MPGLDDAPEPGVTVRAEGTYPDQQAAYELLITAAVRLERVAAKFEQRGVSGSCARSTARAVDQSAAEAENGSLLTWRLLEDAHSAVVSAPNSDSYEEIDFARRVTSDGYRLMQFVNQGASTTTPATVVSARSDFPDSSSTAKLLAKMAKKKYAEAYDAQDLAALKGMVDDLKARTDSGVSIGWADLRQLLRQIDRTSQGDGRLHTDSFELAKYIAFGEPRSPRGAEQPRKAATNTKSEPIARTSSCLRLTIITATLIAGPIALFVFLASV